MQKSMRHKFKQLCFDLETNCLYSPVEIFEIFDWYHTQASKKEKIK
jgi:hypothetical protein